MSATPIDRRQALKALGAAGAAALAGCSGGRAGAGGGAGSDGDGTDTVRAAWLYVSEVGDLGWSWAHDRGRKAVEKRFDWLETDFSEGVAPSDGKRVMREYTNRGYDVVFGTTFEYMDPMYQLAGENPDTVYEHCSGYRTRENMGRYFGRIYQARYLAGVAAGMVTEADALGYVAAFPIPEVVRGINAYTLGARSVNPEVTTEVRWINSWYDPPTEREAARALVDAGVDVMAQHQDSPAALRAAADAGVWATGYDAPMGEFAGDDYLTAPVWNWEVFYAPTVRSVTDGAWESEFYWEGLTSGVVDLDDWGPGVPEEIKSTVSERRSAIEAGDLDVWADSKFADASPTALFQEMGSYVEGVEGEVPSG